MSAKPADQSDGAPQAWSLSPRPERWLKTLAGILLGAGVGVAIALCNRAIAIGAPISGIAAGLTILFLAVAVHEAGHVAGAGLSRMTALRVRVWNLECVRRRSGWRMGWFRSAHPLSGFVLAFPAPGATRADYVRLSVGGPLANLVVGVLAGAVWLLAPLAWYGLLGLAVCIVNIALGGLNLLPLRWPLPSDGLTLLRLARGMTLDGPDSLLPRLMGRLLDSDSDGVDAVADADLVVLEAQPMPMPLLVDSLRLEMAQAREQWPESAEIARVLAQKLESEEISRMPAAGDLVALARAEVAFALSLSEGTQHPLDAPFQLRTLIWLAPWLPPRMAALRAALAGDRDGCRRFLAESERHAEESLFASTRLRERKLRDAVARRLPPTVATEA